MTNNSIKQACAGWKALLGWWWMVGRWVADWGAIIYYKELWQWKQLSIWVKYALWMCQSHWEGLVHAGNGEDCFWPWNKETSSFVYNTKIKSQGSPRSLHLLYMALGCNVKFTHNLHTEITEIGQCKTYYQTWHSKKEFRHGFCSVHD